MVSFDQGTPGQSSSSLWTAAPGGGVCDHSVLIMEGSNVFVLGLSNIFSPHSSRTIGIGSTSSETISYRKTRHGFNKKLMIGNES